MGRETLSVYLNDHLAGSVLAVEMMERTIEEDRETSLGTFLSGLVREIKEDQDALRGLLEQLKVEESPIKQAGAWLGGKIGRLKLGDTRPGALGRLELLETLALGLQGKLKLWLALERVAQRRRELAGVDFRQLQLRAREQHDWVEAYRLEAAVEAL